MTHSFSAKTDQIPARLLSLTQRYGTMMTADSLSTIASLLPSSQTVCVFFPANSTPDVILSAVTFARGLQALGKNVTISSPAPVGEKLQQFVGVNDVTSELGNKNLDVSFPYKEEQVDKVSYHIDEESQRFHLVVQPRKGEKPLDSNKVTFSLSGAEADLIFTFGVDKLEDLEHLYVGYEDLFGQTSVISVHTYETAYGTVKVSVAGAASYAEVIAYLLQELQAEIDPEMATNLLAALESATQTFKSLSVTAQTFEIAGKLLSLGARRVRIQEMSRGTEGVQNSGNFAEVMNRRPPQDQSNRDRDKNRQKNQKNMQPSNFGGVSRS